MKTISFTIETELLRELDAVTSQHGLDRTFVINEAIEQYLALEKSHQEQIEAGTADFEAGRLRPHSEVVALIERWRQAK